MATRLVYKRSDGNWAWNLKADNGRVIATGGNQGYDNEADARAMAEVRRAVGCVRNWRRPRGHVSV